MNHTHDFRVVEGDHAWVGEHGGHVWHLYLSPDVHLSLPITPASLHYLDALRRAVAAARDGLDAEIRRREDEADRTAARVLNAQLAARNATPFGTTVTRVVSIPVAGTFGCCHHTCGPECPGDHSEPCRDCSPGDAA